MMPLCMHSKRVFIQRLVVLFRSDGDIRDGSSGHNPPHDQSDKSISSMATMFRGDDNKVS